MKIPQKHVGQVLLAFEPKTRTGTRRGPVAVDTPTRVFKGKLARDKIAGEAMPNRDDNNESEPVVLPRCGSRATTSRPTTACRAACC